VSTLNLKEALEEKEKEFHGKDDLFGMTLLTNAGYISSSRSIMFTSHLRQFVNLVNPDPPKVFTNYENLVGKYSTGYYKAERELEVIDKIPKFEDGINDDHLYLLFMYDKKNDHYSIIEKRCVEDLTEKYGFAYKTTGIDEKEIGDTIEKGELLYSTTSYDDDLNYMYGTNVKVMYAIDNDTIEDAIKVSESFAKRMVSKEVETIKISLNDNDILANIYGDNDNYKSFPDIGEDIVNKIICAKRRIHNNQILYDLKKSNLRKINFSNDVLFYNSGKVVDINIYCNKPLEEIEDNIFNQQLRKYLILQKKYHKKVYDRCKKILDSGSSYSNDISYYFKRSREILDDDVKWREETSMFSHIVIEFLVERDSPLTIGQKISGRMG